MKNINRNIQFRMSNKKMWISNCWFLLQVMGLCTPTTTAPPPIDGMASNPDIQLFQEYLRINTTTYGDFDPAVAFWTDLAESHGLEVNVYEYSVGQPVIVIKWPGSDPSLRSIMLNSHMDVVPAEADKWTYPPFSATLDGDGVIWSRGTQDMKSVSIQYFLAMERLRENNVSLVRTVYMTLMPDEEVGGPAGMQPFLESEEFAAMNVGCELDEAGASPYESIYYLLYLDRAVWQIKVTCYGSASHGALFPAANNTAVGKCRNVMNTLLDYRQTQYELATANGSDPLANAGKYTSVNLNKINAGTANNIIPDTVEMVFDIRLKPWLNPTAFEQQLYDWISAAGDGIELKFLSKDHQSARSTLTTANPYYMALQSAANELNITLYPIVTPGATDGRFVRLKNIPSYGFTPIDNSVALPHTVDERINATSFLKGIKIYETVIPHMANIPDSGTRDVSDSTMVVQSEYN